MPTAPSLPTSASPAGHPQPDAAAISPSGRLPRHIAIIMDGNGRWAQRRGLPRAFGHQAGAETVRTVVTEAARLGIEALTLYSFSSENWKRPAEEVNALMDLCEAYLAQERERLVANGIRFRRIGRREGLPERVLATLDETERRTAGCARLTLCLALNYGARGEIVDATRRIAREVAEGRLDPAAIDETTIASRLYTAGLPDPDLLIRTAGERRLSNYLLWQISYAEIVVSDVLWPDFGVEALHAALADFARRERKFGDVRPDESSAQAGLGNG